MGSPSVLLVVVSRFCVQEVLQFQSSCFLRRVDMSSFPVSDLVVRKEAGHEYLMFTEMGWSICSICWIIYCNLA